MDEYSSIPNYITELISRFETDQQLLHRNHDSNGKDREAREAWNIRRSENIKFVLDTVRKNGFIGRKRFGIEAYIAAWVLVQHGTEADVEDMEEYLTLMKAQNEEEYSLQHVALLTDKIRIRKGQNQLYGTQFGKDPETGKRITIIPIEDRENVDERRRQMGLDSLEEYLNPPLEE